MIIKIMLSMSNGEKFIISKEKLEKILASQNQIVEVTEDDGEWIGKVINKAHIVCSNVDREATRQANQSNQKQIGEPKVNREQVRERLAEVREKLKTSGAIHGLPS